MLPVRLQETLDTRRNRAGDQFTAALDEPLTIGDRVVVPKGTLFSGHITAAKDSGRLKGRAVMGATLDSFTLNGRFYSIQSSNAMRTSRGHKRRNWALIGGTSAGGAAIGAAAAGGFGALIGAGAGAAGGTTAAIVTGKQHVAIPVETRLMFRLQSGVNVGS